MSLPENTAKQKHLCVFINIVVLNFEQVKCIMYYLINTEMRKERHAFFFVLSRLFNMGTDDILHFFQKKLICITDFAAIN